MREPRLPLDVGREFTQPRARLIAPLLCMLCDYVKGPKNSFLTLTPTIKELSLDRCPPFHSLLNFRQEKTSIGDVPSPDDPSVIVLSTSSYIRYRSVAKRIAGRERQVGLLFFFSEFERWREIQISPPTNIYFVCSGCATP